MATIYSRRRALGLGAGAMLSLGIAGCSSGEGGSGASPNDTATDTTGGGDAVTTSGGNGSSAGPTSSASTAPTAPSKAVTIKVGDKPSANKTAALAKLKSDVSEFSAKHPKITVDPVETKWEAQTFNAMLAGGTLPTVLQVPFTEPQGLIARHQIGDITEVFNALDMGSGLNPSAMDVVKDDAGHIFGIPVDVYSLGLLYNRELFSKAGLDPDTPPQTWKEVQDFARKITKATGAAGFTTLSTKNQGGWILTAMTYSRGGRVEDDEGTKATFNSGATGEVLQMLHDMRWNDDTMGSQFLYDLGSARQDFAAGKIGMMIDQSVAYTGVVGKYGMDPKNYGFGPMPQADPSDSQTLAGGSVVIISRKANEDEQIAGVDWTAFRYLSKYEDKASAVKTAKASRADGDIVGIPRLSPLAADKYQLYASWIAPYTNVPVSNFDPYMKVAFKQSLIPEPASQAQELYASLDPIVQSVLTKKSADIPALLDAAAKAMTAKLSR